MLIMMFFLKKERKSKFLNKENLYMMKPILKIIDFGWSCQFSNKSELQYTTFWTPINMDPILLEKAKCGYKKLHIIYDIKADIW